MSSRLLILAIWLKKLTATQKIQDIAKKTHNHDKYITNNDFNKFSGGIFDERLKQAKLTTYNNINSIERPAIRNLRTFTYVGY